MISQELEEYLERKAICTVDGGLTEEESIPVAWAQVRERLKGKNGLPWLIVKDLKSVGIDPRA